MRAALRSALITALLPAAVLAAGLDIPFLTGRVTDNAQILSADTNRALTELLKAHEIKTGNQIAVLTIPSLDGEHIEEYAAAVFKEWKLGQKEKNNGLLFLVAPNDRRMRIEVGYGLDDTIANYVAAGIIRDVITPRFKAGDMNGGISDGVKAILGILEGGTAPDTQAGTHKKPQIFSGLDIPVPDIPLTMRILMGAFIFGIIGLFTIIGIVTPGAGWFLYLFLIPFWAMFPIIIIGVTGTLYCLITYLIAFPLIKLRLKSSDWYKKAGDELKTTGHASIGGFMVSSGGSGHSWSSGSSGGSSFSGGGGSSGSW